MFTLHSVHSIRKTQLKERALLTHFEQAGFALIKSADMQAELLAQSSHALDDWAAFSQSWHDMPIDPYMADGGRYRRRRYATLSCDDAGNMVLESDQTHYQSLDYNKLNGGIAREFEPIQPEVIEGATMQSILQFCFRTFSHLSPDNQWRLEVHQFRIEASNHTLAQPTPEGVHRDGVDYVLVLMIKRENILSGTTTMYDLEQKTLDSFTLTEPLDCALVNDKRCMHGVTPIEPFDETKPAFRDVLVVTFKMTAAKVD
jgi:hypothetical protein